MTRKRANPAGEGGALDCLAWRLDASECTQKHREMQGSARIDTPRFHRMVERLHRLGPRLLGELLAEIAAATGQHVRVVDLVEEYAALDPDLLRFLGAVRLAKAGRVLGIAEGIEDALSAMQLCNLPCWASLGGARLARVDLPPEVREVHIFADGDDAGREFAEKAVRRYRREGLKARAFFPRTVPRI